MDGMNSEETAHASSLLLLPHLVVCAGKEDAFSPRPVLSVRMPVESLLFLQIIHTAPVKRASSLEHLQIPCSSGPEKFGQHSISAFLRHPLP